MKRTHFEVWLSLVERYVRDVEAASSNLVTSTIAKRDRHCDPQTLRVTSYSPIGEDSLALRLESQLSDLRSWNANLILWLCHRARASQS